MQVFRKLLNYIVNFALKYKKEKQQTPHNVPEFTGCYKRPEYLSIL